MLEFDPEFTQPYFKIILGGEAGIAELAGEVGPVGEAAVVEGFKGICDDKGDDVVGKACFEHDETADTAVAILEGVNETCWRVPKYEIRSTRYEMRSMVCSEICGARREVQRGDVFHLL